MTTTTDSDARALRHVALAVEEAEAVLRLLPVVQDLQWDRSHTASGEADETRGRRVVGAVSDPTADIATDPARLYLRSVLGRAGPALAFAAGTLGGVRRGLERALDRWENIADEDGQESTCPR